MSPRLLHIKGFNVYCWGRSAMAPWLKSRRRPASRSWALLVARLQGSWPLQCAACAGCTIRHPPSLFEQRRTGPLSGPTDNRSPSFAEAMEGRPITDNRFVILYPMGSNWLNTSTSRSPLTPITTSSGVQVVRVSFSVSPPILQITQKALSFIQEMTRDPKPIAAKR